MDFYLPFGRIQSPSNNLEQRAFATAIAPNNADRLAFLDIERNIVQCPELTTIHPPATPKHLLEPILRAIIDAIHLANPTHADCDFGSVDNRLRRARKLDYLCLLSDHRYPYSIACGG